MTPNLAIPELDPAGSNLAIPQPHKAAQYSAAPLLYISATCGTIPPHYTQNSVLHYDTIT